MSDKRSVRRALGLEGVPRECYHTWKALDEDDKFKKQGNYEIMRIKEKCVECGKTQVRKVKRRL